MNNNKIRFLKAFLVALGAAFFVFNGFSMGVDSVAKIETLQAASRGYLDRKQLAYKRARKVVDSFVVETESLRLKEFKSLPCAFYQHFTSWWFLQDELAQVEQSSNIFNALMKIYAANVEYYVYQAMDLQNYEGKELEKELDINFYLTHDIEFQVFKTMVGKNFIVINTFEIAERFRNQKIGHFVFRNMVAELKQRHPDFVILGKAYPFGSKPLSIEQLCNFYKKCECEVFNKNSKSAYFYVKGSGTSF